MHSYFFLSAALAAPALARPGFWDWAKLSTPTPTPTYAYSYGAPLAVVDGDPSTNPVVVPVYKEDSAPQQWGIKPTGDSSVVTIVIIQQPAASPSPTSPPELKTYQLRAGYALPPDGTGIPSNLVGPPLTEPAEDFYKCNHTTTSSSKLNDFCGDFDIYVHCWSPCKSLKDHFTNSAKKYYIDDCASYCKTKCRCTVTPTDSIKTTTITKTTTNFLLPDEIFPIAGPIPLRNSVPTYVPLKYVPSPTYEYAPAKYTKAGSADDTDGPDGSDPDPDATSARSSPTKGVTIVI
ncbi:MAG: hypothetical protein M1829_003374 [Trizodia sp. TS-e1964]|nr:MAG: hypothetical protein M1829_003374 [Trizodia sp. TS-e1964]